MKQGGGDNDDAEDRDRRAGKEVHSFSGAVKGFVCGTWMSFVFLILGMGAGAFPLVGWVMAVGFVGLALASPFIGAWLGYTSRR